jgi:transposase
MKKITFSIDQINKIIEEYINNCKSIATISKLINIGETPIKKFLRSYDLLRPSKSNGQKIYLTEEQKNQIFTLYKNEYKNYQEIAIELSLTKSFINKYIHKSGISRNKSEGASIGLVRRYSGLRYDLYVEKLPEFIKYKKQVNSITNKQPIMTLPNYNKRGISGQINSYQLDHKYSILEGFKNNVNPEIIGNIKNLEFIPWEDNASKRHRCTITLEQLIQQ